MALSDMIRGRQVVEFMTNKSGGALVAGDVVIIDTGNDAAFTTTTSGQSTSVLGVVQESIANNATGRVCTAGYVPLVNVNASVTRGHFAETHTVAKQATGNSTRRTGSFARFLTGGTTPTAHLFGMVDFVSSGNAMATDALWDAAGDLAVGTGADTGAKLTKGADGTALTMISGAVAWALTQPTNNIVATSQTLLANNSWVDLATAGPAVTVVVPASGVVKVTVCAHASNGTAGGYAGMGFALSSGNTVAATNTKCLQFGTTAATFDHRAAATFLLTGLTPGSTVFTAKYNQFGGPGTTAWTDREIIVEPCP